MFTRAGFAVIVYQAVLLLSNPAFSKSVTCIASPFQVPFPAIPSLPLGSASSTSFGTFTPIVYVTEVFGFSESLAPTLLRPTRASRGKAFPAAATSPPETPSAFNWNSLSTSFNFLSTTVTVDELLHSSPATIPAFELTVSSSSLSRAVTDTDEPFQGHVGSIIVMRSCVVNAAPSWRPIGAWFLMTETAGARLSPESVGILDICGRINALGSPLAGLSHNDDLQLEYSNFCLNFLRLSLANRFITFKSLMRPLRVLSTSGTHHGIRASCTGTTSTDSDTLAVLLSAAEGFIVVYPALILLVISNAIVLQVAFSGAANLHNQIIPYGKHTIDPLFSLIFSNCLRKS